MDRPQPALLPNLAMVAAAMVLDSHCPDAFCAFLAGPIMRGEGARTSPLDLVVIGPDGDPSRRDAVVSDGFSFRLWVERPATLLEALGPEVMPGRPGLIQVLAEGRIIGSDMTMARLWQGRARAVLASRPDLPAEALAVER